MSQDQTQQTPTSSSAVPYAPTSSGLLVYATFELYEDGSPRHITLKNQASLLDANGVPANFSANTEIVLSPDGKVLSAIPAL